jgi:zinc protease
LETAASAAVRLVLPNGLTIILKENHANPTVALHGVVKAGAIFDPPGKSGLGMFTGGMLDQGTRTRTSFEQASAIENLGASLRFEGGSETVTLHGTMLSEDLEEVLAVLADAVRNPVFPPDEVEKIRGELLNEYRIAENSTSRPMVSGRSRIACSRRGRSGRRPSRSRCPRLRSSRGPGASSSRARASRRRTWSTRFPESRGPHPITTP